MAQPLLAILGPLVFVTLFTRFCLKFLFIDLDTLFLLLFPHFNLPLWPEEEVLTMSL